MELRITCDNCGTEYKIPKDKFQGKPSRFACKSCEQEIYIIPDGDDVKVSGGTSRSPFEAETPRQLGKFKDLRRLASGGMGNIFLAKQSGAEGFERDVVLKVLHAHLARDANFAKAMVDEAKITVSMNHPNIVQMFNLEKTGELLYCVMEFVPGKSLAAVQRAYRRKGGTIPTNMAVYCVAEALEGLAYAHELKDPSGEPLHIVHRDISPHNIMVTADGWVKIIDFGIAKAATRITETQPGTIKGKFAYMAPEQLKGTSDYRADLFAMGVVLWEALAGIRLFYSSTDVDTLQKVLHLDPPPISMSKPGIPKKMDAILEKALSKDPDERFQNAREFKAELVKFMAPTNLQDLRTEVDIDAECLGDGVVGEEGDQFAHDAATPVADFTIAEKGMARERGKGAGSRSGWLWVVTVLVLLVGAGVGAWFGLPWLRGAGPDSTDAGGGILPPPQDGSAATVVDAGVTVAADPGPVDAGAVASADERPDAGERVVIHKPPAPKPIKLTRRTIQRRLQQNGARLQACADTHLLKAGVGNNVDLVLDFTIGRSGKVLQSSLKPVSLESSQFGRCLKGRVQRMKFPRHVDQSVTVSFPLKFQAVGR